MKKLSVLVCILVLSACSGHEGSQVDSSAVANASTPAVNANQPASVPSSTKPAAPPCPHTGKWAPCSVERRLKQSGFVVKRLTDEAPKRPGFSVTPIVFSLGASRLEVFLYGDSVAVARDVAAMDTVTVAPRGSKSPWENPIFIRSGNLAAVLTSRNPRQVERVILAITAGAPQPGSSR